jgi:hypothetical protein
MGIPFTDSQMDQKFVSYLTKTISNSSKAQHLESMMAQLSLEF